MVGARELRDPHRARSLVFGIVAVVSGASLLSLGLSLSAALVLADSPPGRGGAARPFLSAGGVLLMVGAALIVGDRAAGPIGLRPQPQRRDALLPTARTRSDILTRRGAGGGARLRRSEV
jgi:hypothetical protein